MKAGAYIGLGYALLSIFFQLLFMGRWTPMEWLIVLATWIVIGGMIGLVIEALIYFMNQIGKLFKH